MRGIFTVCGLEFRRFKKSIFLWIGVVLLIIVPLGSTPLFRSFLFNEIKTVYLFLLSFCSVLFMFIPVLMINLYYYESTTDISMVMFTQPISKYQYALGKFLSVFLIQLFYCITGLVLLTFVPLKFGKPLYMPYYFIKPFLFYYLPTAFFICALCYLIIIIFKNPIIEFFLALIIYICSFKLFNGRFQIIINGIWLSLIETGNANSQVEQAILTNRLIIIISGVVLLIFSLIIYSPKSYIDKGGRI